MAGRKGSRREIVLAGAGLLAGGTALAFILDRITDPSPVGRLSPLRPAIADSETDEDGDQSVPERPAARKTSRGNAQVAAEAPSAAALKAPENIGDLLGKIDRTTQPAPKPHMPAAFFRDRVGCGTSGC